MESDSGMYKYEELIVGHQVQHAGADIAAMKRRGCDEANSNISNTTGRWHIITWNMNWQYAIH